MSWICATVALATVLAGALRLDAQDGRGVELFGRGTISTEAPEFAIAFTPDGNTVFFNRATPDRAALVLFMSRRMEGGWGPPVRLPFSGTWRDVDPFMSSDGARLWFSSNRPRGDGSAVSFDTWYVERNGDTFGLPINPGFPINSDSNDVFVSVTRDGTLAFSSNRDGGTRIFLARATAGGWEPPGAVRFSDFSGGSNPLISPDGRFIVFVKEGPADVSDLHVSCRGPGGWSEPINLAAANSPFADFAPAFDPAGEFLYFTSERPGVSAPQPAGVRPPGDLYRIPLSSLPIPCR